MNLSKHIVPGILGSLLFLLAGQSARAGNESKGVAFARNIIGQQEVEKGLKVVGQLDGSFLFLSWKFWTLIGGTVHDSTAAWMITKPLKILDSRGKGTRETVVPDAVAAKITLYDLIVDLEVTQLHRTCPKCKLSRRRIGGYYLRFDPGAMGNPIMGQLQKIQYLTKKKRARYWSFNMPSNPGWRRLFGNRSRRRFLSSYKAKQIVRVAKKPDRKGHVFAGFELGWKKSHRPFYVPSNWDLPSKTPEFTSFNIRRISFNMAPVLAWYAKKLKEKKLHKAKTRSLEAQLDNLAAACKLPVGTIRHALAKMKKLPPEQARKKIAAMLNKIAAGPMPRALAASCDKKRLEELKNTVMERLARREQALRRAEAKLIKRAKRLNRKARWHIRKKRSRLERKARRKGRPKRLVFCPACVANKPFATPVIRRTVARVPIGSMGPKGTWKDPRTGLMWMTKPLTVTRSYNVDHHKGALKLCQRSGVGGFKDWRVPTISELHTIATTVPIPFKHSYKYIKQEVYIKRPLAVPVYGYYWLHYSSTYHNKNGYHERMMYCFNVPRGHKSRSRNCGYVLNYVAGRDKLPYGDHNLYISPMGARVVLRCVRKP